MLPLPHPLVMNPVLCALLEPQLAHCRVCLFCAQKGRESRGCNMSETCANGTVREKRTQDTYHLHLGDVTGSARKRTEKETFLPQKARHTHYCGARLIEQTRDSEIRRVKGHLFSAHSGIPTWGPEWGTKPSSVESFAAHSCLGINLTAWPPFGKPESSSRCSTNESEAKEQGLALSETSATMRLYYLLN